MTTIARTDVRFRSGGGRCAAWIFPATSSGPAAADAGPSVVLAHGFGGVRQASLDAFAERFARAGITALVFDYRHFGASTGEPRQLLDIRRHGPRP